MSGLPALRCFIFLAIDLFILLLPSFAMKRLNIRVGGHPYTASDLLLCINPCPNPGNLRGFASYINGSTADIKMNDVRNSTKTQIVESVIELRLAVNPSGNCSRQGEFPIHLNSSIILSAFAGYGSYHNPGAC
jgi:hypothetical protein